MIVTAALSTGYAHTVDQCCGHEETEEHNPKAVKQETKGKTLWQRIERAL